MKQPCAAIHYVRHISAPNDTAALSPATANQSDRCVPLGALARHSLGGGGPIADWRRQFSRPSTILEYPPPSRFLVIPLARHSFSGGGRDHSVAFDFASPFPVPRRDVDSALQKIFISNNHLVIDICISLCYTLACRHFPIRISLRIAIPRVCPIPLFPRNPCIFKQLRIARAYIFRKSFVFIQI
jgi:hypothetical protein